MILMHIKSVFPPSSPLSLTHTHAHTCAHRSTLLLLLLCVRRSFSLELPLLLSLSLSRYLFICFFLISFYPSPVLRDSMHSVFVIAVACVCARAHILSGRPRWRSDTDNKDDGRAETVERRLGPNIICVSFIYCLA